MKINNLSNSTRYRIAYSCLLICLQNGYDIDTCWFSLDLNDEEKAKMLDKATKEFEMENSLHCFKE